MEAWFSSLLHNNLFLLFFIISLGKILENIRIADFSLGIASVFLIAAGFGYFGYVLPQDMQFLGLGLFVYCIGIESGPQIFRSLDKSILKQLILPLIFFCLTAILIIGVMIIMPDYPAGMYTGLYAGAMKSPTAMAAFADRFADHSMSIAFGIIYPVCLLGNLYLIPALPRIFRQNIPFWIDDFSARSEVMRPKRVARIFKITDPAAIGKSLRQLPVEKESDVVFSRYIKNGNASLAQPDTILEKDAFLTVTGTKEHLTALGQKIGEKVELDTALVSSGIQSRKILVSKRSAAGKSLSQLGLETDFDLHVTRVVRSNVELSPLFVKHLYLGDKLSVVGTDEALDAATKILGDDIEEGYRARFAPISIGIVLGIIAGYIPFPFLGSLGLTAGILLFAMYLGYKVKLFGILWQIPRPTGLFIKELGLYIFLAGMGTNAGKPLIETFIHPESILLLIICFVLSLVPVIIMYVIGTYIFRKNPLELLGTMAGMLSSTSMLMAINNRWKSEIPNYSFAVIFPLCLILSILFTGLMAFIVPFFI